MGLSTFKIGSKEAKETIDPPYDWRDSPTWIVLRTVQFFPNFTAIPTCSLVTVVLREWVRSLLTLSPIEHQPLAYASNTQGKT